MDTSRNNGRVLIIEDQASIRRFIGDYLRQNGYEVIEAWSLEAAYRTYSLLKPNFIILDVLLDEEDGLDFIRSKPGDTVIIVVSSQGSAIDRVTALELGADDYLVKPIEPRELLLRLQRIKAKYAEYQASNNLEVIADVTIDLVERIMVGPSRRRAKLTLSELILLRLLVDEKGVPIPKQDMSRKVLRHGVEGGSRALDVMVSKLRRKLSDVDSQVSIQSVRSMGYMAQIKISQP